MSEFMKPCQIWGKRFYLAVGREAFAAAQYPWGGDRGVEGGYRQGGMRQITPAYIKRSPLGLAPQ